MQEIPKHPPRRPSILGLGVGQVLRPSLAPSTAFSPSPGEHRSRSPSGSSSAKTSSINPPPGSSTTNNNNNNSSPAQRHSRTSTFFSRTGNPAHSWRVSAISTSTATPPLLPPHPPQATAVGTQQHGGETIFSSSSPHPGQQSSTSRRSSSLILGTSHQHYIPPIATAGATSGIATLAGDVAMPERVGSASSSRAPHTGVAASVTAESAIWPSSRRTSSVFNRRGTVAFQHNGSQIDLGERTSSKLTLDEELYDLLFAYG